VVDGRLLTTDEDGQPGTGRRFDGYTQSLRRARRSARRSQIAESVPLQVRAAARIVAPRSSVLDAMGTVDLTVFSGPDGQTGGSAGKVP
jgi:hypothetical protein